MEVWEVRGSDCPKFAEVRSGKSVHVTWLVRVYFVNDYCFRRYVNLYIWSVHIRHHLRKLVT